MAKLQKLQCDNCGGKIDGSTLICQSCGMQFRLEDNPDGITLGRVEVYNMRTLSEPVFLTFEEADKINNSKTQGLAVCQCPIPILLPNGTNCHIVEYNKPYTCAKCGTDMTLYGGKDISSSTLRDDLQKFAMGD